MLTNLQKINTDIGRIHEIPTRFFEQIEASVAFGDHLFPDWTRGVFDGTTFFGKFEDVYHKYKAIADQNSRDLIVRAFEHNNRVEDLCNIVHGVDVIELIELDHSIREYLKTLFSYLYNTALNYHGYTNFVGATVGGSIDGFIRINKLGNVCPFCGLESFLNLEGQSRLALDHWLCQDLFPVNSVNFDNLIPIGDKCNGRPAKGNTNILIDSPVSRNRIIAYYPYQAHHETSSSFNYINEPSIDGETDKDWQLIFEPVEVGEQEMFDSWNSVFNIEKRYLDYYRKNIFDLWEEEYKEFIEEDNALIHATTLDEFKSNLKTYRSGFPIKRRIGSVLFRPFLNYLINDATEAHLTGLYMQFRE